MKMMPKAARNSNSASGCRALRDFIEFLRSEIVKMIYEQRHFNRKTNQARPSPVVAQKSGTIFSEE
jgi:hypothetical protein